MLHDSDVLFAPNSSDYSVFAVLAWGMILNKPVAYDPHGTIFYSQIVNRNNFTKDSVIGKLFYVLDRTAARLSDLYVVYSEYMADTLKEEFGLHEKLVVGYTGVVESRFDVSAPDFSYQVEVLYWGTFIEFHGVDLVLQAAEELEEVRFVFVGDSDNRSRYYRIADELGLDNVDFTGRIPQEKLVAYIRSADLVLGKFRNNLYSEFTITNKIAEAAFMAKPILTAESPAIQEVFNHGESAILCSPESHEEIIGEITDFYNGRYDGEYIGSNARKRYEDLLSSDRIGARLSRAFGNLGDG